MVYQIFLLLVLKVGYDLIFRSLQRFIIKYDRHYYKCVSFFIKKCYKSLLQKAPPFSLQNSKVLFQNAKHIRKCDNFIKKMQQLLQNASVQCIFRTTSIHHNHKKTFRFSRLWVHALVD